MFHSMYYGKALTNDISVSCKAKALYLFVVWAVRRIMLGWLVHKIVILSFWVGTSKNKNIDNQVKETSLCQQNLHVK